MVCDQSRHGTGPSLIHFATHTISESLRLLTGDQGVMWHIMFVRRYLRLGRCRLSVGTFPIHLSRSRGGLVATSNFSSVLRQESIPS